LHVGVGDDEKVEASESWRISATARFTAVPYPRFPPVRSSRVFGNRSTASSGLPSVEPLSAMITVTGRSVACDSVDEEPAEVGSR
jgi:hypothetical protein